MGKSYASVDMARYSEPKVEGNQCLGDGMAIKKLLFIDTNIWLDFYRARTEAGLSLLEHLDQIADKIIVTSQVEMEFKKNRQHAIKEGIDALKSSAAPSRPGIFSDAKETKSILASQKKTEASVKKLISRYVKALESPATSDPVYRICQRIFHKADGLVLTREMPARKFIRRRALRRFLLGYPPRKGNDTSMGDAFNWEWMLECANSHKAELVIVSRDADYGSIVEKKGYPNDHLLQEFHDRVSRKRKLLLYNKLSEALQHFEIAVTEKEKIEEEELVHAPTPTESTTDSGLKIKVGDVQIADLSANPTVHEALQRISKRFAATYEALHNPELQERLSTFARNYEATLEQLRSPEMQERLSRINRVVKAFTDKERSQESQSEATKRSGDLPNTDQDK
jgi:hypothetical protein